MDSTVSFPILHAFGDIVDIPLAQLASLHARDVHAHSCCGTIGQSPSNSLLAELGWRVVSTATQVRTTSSTRSSLYARDDDNAYLHVHTSGDGSAVVTVLAATSSEADEIFRVLQELCPDEAVESTTDTVPVYFHWNSRGVQTRTRPVSAPAWDEVSANYPTETRHALDELHNTNGHSLESDSGRGGRLILFHGNPGTGKTTALRSLARSWSPWCDTLYVLDPEILFGDPEYLIEVAMEGDGLSRRLGRLVERERLDEAEADTRWRLVVLEDVDELIRGDAKQRTGQALARLLNLTDGLLGQGLRTMFLLTTNEPMNVLHSAVSRPGRCLANINFRPFSRVEAGEWLAAAGVGGHVETETTLAELYARRKGGTISTAQSNDTGSGVYL